MDPKPLRSLIPNQLEPNQVTKLPNLRFDPDQPLPQEIIKNLEKIKVPARKRHQIISIKDEANESNLSSSPCSLESFNNSPPEQLKHCTIAVGDHGFYQGLPLEYVLTNELKVNEVECNCLEGDTFDGRQQN